MLLSALARTQVRVAEFNASTPFASQLAAMAATSVFVSVHTSNLANAQFLQPGAAVVELLQRHWVWDNLDRSFQVPCLPACRAPARIVSTRPSVQRRAFSCWHHRWNSNTILSASDAGGASLPGCSLPVWHSCSLARRTH